MDSIESEAEALQFLKARRTEDSPGAPEESQEIESSDEEQQAESYLEDEAEQEEAVEIDDTEEESYFDIDGEEITLDQIREWKRGFLRESDYTQKTQALSSERKEIEGIKQKQAEKLEKLDTTISELESLLQTEEESIDWDELIETDPSQYLKLQKQQKARRDKIDAVKQKREAEMAKAREEYLNQQASKLRELIPDWIDDGGNYTESMSNEIPNIHSYLQSKALGPDDINQVVDARLWAVFRDASRYNAIKDKKPTVDRQLKKAPKVIKPTKGGRKAVRPSHVDEAAKKFRQSGSERDALAYLKAKRS